MEHLQTQGGLPGAECEPVEMAWILHSGCLAQGGVNYRCSNTTTPGRVWQVPRKCVKDMGWEFRAGTGQISGCEDSQLCRGGAHSPNAGLLVRGAWQGRAGRKDLSGDVVQGEKRRLSCQ